MKIGGRGSKEIVLLSSAIDRLELGHLSALFACISWVAESLVRCMLPMKPAFEMCFCHDSHSTV